MPTLEQFDPLSGIKKIAGLLMAKKAQEFRDANLGKSPWERTAILAGIDESSPEERAQLKGNYFQDVASAGPDAMGPGILVGKIGPKEIWARDNRGKIKEWLNNGPRQLRNEIYNSWRKEVKPNSDIKETIKDLTKVGAEFSDRSLNPKVKIYRSTSISEKPSQIPVTSWTPREPWNPTFQAWVPVEDLLYLEPAHGQRRMMNWGGEYEILAPGEKLNEVSTEITQGPPTGIARLNSDAVGRVNRNAMMSESLNPLSKIIEYKELLKRAHKK